LRRLKLPGLLVSIGLPADAGNGVVRYTGPDSHMQTFTLQQCGSYRDAERAFAVGSKSIQSNPCTNHEGALPALV
jgi:hypothetical protein